jgi:NAD(P)-dependent dehydrogenase (short-subunit alcohol dehydrogenase family)
MSSARGGLALCVSALAASVASAGIRIPLVSPKTHVIRRDMALGDWRLAIVHNPFSGEVICHLRAKLDGVN